MNAWRCNDCHYICADPPQNGPLLVCPLCGGLVLNVTHTEIGRAFLEQCQRPVPQSIQQSYMHRRAVFFTPNERTAK